MATEQQAKDTFAEVRAFYKGGIKSNNKSYFMAGQPWQHRTPKANEGLSENQEKRNLQCVDNIKHSLDHPESRKPLAKTPYLSGQIRVKRQNTAGNCGEMAEVAAYIAIQHYHVPDDEVSVATLSSKRKDVKGTFFKHERKFEHTFVILGRKANSNSERWVVDPWAGVCCSLESYKTELRLKLDEWMGEGKRICIPSKNNKYSSGWAEPTNDLITGILAESAEYEEVRAVG